MRKTIILFLMFIAATASAQNAKTPAGCKIYLDGEAVTEISKDVMMKWCETSPPEVKCDDGKIYKLDTFKITFLTLKPFMKYDFGIGQQGFPIKARQAVANGNSGDTIILNEVTYLDAEGNTQTLPTLSFKIQ